MMSRANSSAFVFSGRTIGFTVLLLVSSPIVQACLWDWDTLQMERRKFPGVLEMITGKFVRHSREYYQWRIDDRLKRMRSPADDPQLADDVAVAYLKLGRHAEAIDLLEQVLQAHPDRYETLANLGTVQMLAGNLQRGKVYIDRAIIINPNAHFGREKYQSLLAEYFLTVRVGPPSGSTGFMMVGKDKPAYFGFAQFILKTRENQLLPSLNNEQLAKHDLKQDMNGPRMSLGLSETVVNEELAAAQKAVLGMMHFANYDSPYLLEVLGDVLVSWPTHDSDGLQLAARAYYRAAQFTNDKETKKKLERAAEDVVEGQYDYIKFRGDFEKNSPHRAPLEKLSAELNKESAEAQKYVSQIADDEKRWIREGVNVDQAFAAKYYDSLDDTIKSAERQLAKEPRDVRARHPSEQRAITFVLSCVGVVSVIATIVVVWSTWGSRPNRSRLQKADRSATKA